MTAPVVRFEALTRRFGETTALDALTAEIADGRITGLVGPDGAGKTTLLRLVAGLLLPDAGELTVLGHDPVADAAAVHAGLGYMPQSFGLYEELSVRENLDLYADLRGLVADEREATYQRLLDFTDLAAFTGRLAGKLSGGMKQKLGLACALISRPRLLLLDEPSVGVDPMSRRELWGMAEALREDGVAVVWATAYLDEAEKCDEVLLLDRGRLLFAGPPDELTEEVAGRVRLVGGFEEERRRRLAEAIDRDDVLDGTLQGRSLRLVLAEGEEDAVEAWIEGCGGESAPVEPRFEDAFVARLGGSATGRSPLGGEADERRFEREAVIEARGLTKRFGDFTAAEDMDFSIRPGEIFGLLGPNGAGKSTTFKMLCGLAKPSAGEGRVAGIDLLRSAAEARGRLGYMAQTFSLYGDLSAKQNLDFFAGVYGLDGRRRRERVGLLVETFDFGGRLRSSAKDLPLGFKKRLALACAVLHEPDALFLDEPTSGVDPLTRRDFWSHINALVERGVGVLVTTHFMDEAEYCDRIALIFRGRIIATGSPDELKARAATDERPEPSLEDAFIHLVEASGEGG
ncbi:MAG: ATP-binding cassette domain-containing protein [Pseudomonadota bacterium]